ncbi:hypothetical protein LZZ85_28170 [Terrimonas sp. NA20]|uniref:Uncharacterized protein n=1 Tax=Terrimonas ginsenosidimutans TaxID=2908004 RepID=A0ABS9L157_9BACT|nr:hypothetical protein [Terrimonas ginsenosidimutans]MCG2618204.1 hypothetical protein [Terrimonas ginsenosidimutans]
MIILYRIFIVCFSVCIFFTTSVCGQENQIVLTSWTAKTICDLESKKNRTKDSFLIDQMSRRQMFIVNQNGEPSFRFCSVELFKQLRLECIEFVIEEFMSGEQFSYNVYVFTNTDSVFSYSYNKGLRLEKQVKRSSKNFSGDSNPELFSADHFFISTKFRKGNIESVDADFYLINELDYLRKLTN